MHVHDELVFVSGGAAIAGVAASDEMTRDGGVSRRALNRHRPTVIPASLLVPLAKWNHEKQICAVWKVSDARHPIRSGRMISQRTKAALTKAKARRRWFRVER